MPVVAPVPPPRASPPSVRSLSGGGGVRAVCRSAVPPRCSYQRRRYRKLRSRALSPLRTPCRRSARSRSLTHRGPGSVPPRTRVPRRLLILSRRRETDNPAATTAASGGIHGQNHCIDVLCNCLTRLRPLQILPPVPRGIPKQKETPPVLDHFHSQTCLNIIYKCVSMLSLFLNRIVVP